MSKYFTYGAKELAVLISFFMALFTREFPFHVSLHQSNAGIAQSVQVGRSGDRISVGVRFSEPVQIGPDTHPSSITVGTVSFPVVKRSGRGVNHLPPSSNKVK